MMYQLQINPIKLYNPSTHHTVVALSVTEMLHPHIVKLTEDLIENHYKH